MKKSICIEKILLEYDFYERFRIVAEQGFEYVEFWSWKTRDLEKIIRICHQYKLKIASISGDKDFSLIIEQEGELYLEYLRESIVAAQRLECKFIVLHSNAINEKGKITNTGENISDQDKMNAAYRTLKAAAKMVEGTDICLVVEALNTYTQPGCFLTATKQSGDLVRRVKSPNVKILYDIWHMQQMEGNLIYHMTEYKDVIGYIHIADVPGRHEPGSGEINFCGIKKAVNDTNYSGIWGFELDPSIDSMKSLEIILRF